MMLLLVHTTLVVYVACTQVVAADSVTLVLALSGDAVPTDTPGEYVVPEKGNVTFTCNNSDSAPVWKVDLKTLGNSSGFSHTETLLPQLHNVDSSDIGSFPNPTSFTVHNIPTESNGSYVECSAQGRANSIAIIFVEGSPNCPIIQTIFTEMDSLAVSVQQLHKTWLTVCYNVEVTSTNMSIVMMYNSTITIDGFVEVTSLQPGTVYSISVTPCNMAGCNKSCDMYSVQTNAVPTGGDPGGGAVGHSFLTIGLPLIAVAVLAILTVLVLVMLLTLFYRRRRLRGKQKKGGTERGGIEDKCRNTMEYAEMVPNATSAKENSLQGPAKAAHTSAPGACPMEYSTVQDAVMNSRQKSMKTATLPPVSPPPPPPCTPRDVTKCIDADSVQDAGYATVPQSQGSKRITKVRGTQQNTNQKCENNVDSPDNSVKV